MFSTIIQTATDPSFVLAVLVSISVFATFVTILMPMFDRGGLETRMKSVALAREEAVGERALFYLNLLSDALFVMARWENHRRGTPEQLWDSRA